MTSFLAYPKLFVVLVFCCVILIVLIARRYAWQKKTAALLGAQALRYFSLPRKLLKAVLLSLGLGFLAYALARPQWGEITQTVSQESRDVLIALDISRSMLAQDLEPSRIEAAKRKIKELLSRLTAERVSLLVFSGIALVQCPFTNDLSAFLSFLDLADVESISTGTTAIDKALSSALDAFAAVPGRASRIMIMFTDGEDFSTDLVEVGAKAKAQGLHIFTVGVGTPEGAPIPLYDTQGVSQGHQKDAQGNVVISRLNETLLDQIAKQTGGFYIQMTKSDDDIATLIKAVHRFEKEKIDDKTFAIKEERYMPFALMSAILLLLEWLL